MLLRKARASSAHAQTEDVMRLHERRALDQVRIRDLEREFRPSGELCGSVTLCAGWPYYSDSGVVVTGVGDYIGGSAVGARWLTVPHRI